MQVAEDHGQRGERPEDAGHIGGEGGEGSGKHTQQGGKPGDLGAGRHEGRHRGGRALVDIRRPHVEGNRGDLEAKSHQDEAPRRWSGAGSRLPSEPTAATIPLRDVVPGRAEDQRSPVDDKSGGERAEQEVFETCLLRFRLGAGKGCQHIKRDGKQFQRQEDHDQVSRPAP